MDVLTYTYSGKLLKAFMDNGSYGTVEYEYDNNGNLASDYNKGILSISYNHLNLQGGIVFASTRKIDYLYTADGTG
jgi:hypothetical protein